MKPLLYIENEQNSIFIGGHHTFVYVFGENWSPENACFRNVVGADDSVEPAEEAAQCSAPTCDDEGHFDTLNCRR